MSNLSNFETKIMTLMTENWIIIFQRETKKIVSNFIISLLVPKSVHNVKKTVNEKPTTNIKREESNHQPPTTHHNIHKS